MVGTKVHCPKNTLNIIQKTETVAVYSMYICNGICLFLRQIFGHTSQTYEYTVVSSPAITKTPFAEINSDYF